jgi:hypothetical protein
MLQELINKARTIRTPTSDIDTYFNSSPIESSSLDDPDWVLNWWRVYEGECPIMSQVAQAYLLVPVAEVDASI